MQILPPRAEELAKALAEERKVSVVEAVVQALESEWRREAEKRELTQRLRGVADKLAAKGEPGGQAMTKADIDAMWGH